MRTALKERSDDLAGRGASLVTHPPSAARGEGSRDPSLGRSAGPTKKPPMRFLMPHSRGRVLMLAALSIALLAGCAHMRPAPGVSDLAALRERAEARPGDVVAQRQLLLAEMFAYDGDPERVDAQLERAQALGKPDLRLLLAAGLHHDTHGRPAQAADAYVQALELAAEGTTRLSPFVAELAVNTLAGVDGGVPGYVGKVEPLLLRLLSEHALPLPARHDAGALAMRLAYRRGDRAAAQGIALQLGCMQQMRVAGPFGPRELLGFDRDHGVDMAASLAARYDLGPGRGVRDTRDLGARACSVTLGGSPVGRGGTSYVQGQLQVREDGEYLMRFESPNSAELRIDGELVHRVDRRTELKPGVLFLPVKLSAGTHLLSIKLTTRHPNPTVSVALSPATAVDRRAVGLPFDASTEAGFPRYLRGSIALLRGDILGARETLEGVERAPQVAPLLSLLRASLFMSDPLYPLDLRADEGRRMLMAALQRDPGLWNPAVQLATMAADNGRVKEAIAALREAEGRWPAVPAVGLTLVDLLRSQDWNAEADAVVERVSARVPDACGPMNAQLDALRLRKREAEAQVVTERLMACEAQSNARYSMLLRQRKWDAALRELDRLQALEPPQNRYAWLLARLELAKNRGDAARVQQLVAELRTRYPQSQSALIEEVDLALGGGDAPAALSALQRALDREHEAHSELHRLAPVLGGEHVLEPYRMDGAAAIERFEASGRSYDEPQVLVFDYMAVRVFEDGSSVEVVHTIQKAQSDEAIDELAEVRVPEGARILTLHTIKPDGRRLEPDAIAGKDTISLPSVASGDYVELEYIVHEPASEGFPEGYLGARFYFRSFEVPFDYSHMVVVLPKDLPYDVDPRGPAPAVEERVDGDVRVLSFKVEQSEALEAEPGSVTAREYLPSIRVGARASWDAFVESIREALVDRDVQDPEIAALVQEILAEGRATRGSARDKATRLYAWVLENVENNNDMFSQAATMLRARAGNRTRVLRYLLELAGVETDLALVRSATADTTESKMADGDTYDYLLLTFESGGAREWIFTAERWAPYGFVPALLRGQPALLLDGERLTVAPSRDGQDRRTLTLDVTLRQDGGARVDVVEEVRGSGAVAWRANLESVPAAELEHRFEEEYVARLLPGATLAALEIRGRELSAQAVTLAYSFDVDVLGRRVSGGWALPAMLAQKLAHNYAKLSSRTTQQLVGSPLDTDVILRFEFPPGATRPSVPEEIRLVAAMQQSPHRPSFTLEGRYEGETLVIERKVRLPLMRVTPEDYKVFASFCRMVDAAEAKELMVGLSQ